ncbi:hypothetical protein JQX09_17725 [Sulfitobacter pseudonitzschiae]|uniref:Uncharacterized protein n=1 Tax=Pseudosulfitobacter pseudonitzschiae TaxID=1402135 RepID=A0A9Q2NSZ5_9RHOB|nr:hypothetical protein [Pseudosulfitobacter pseudonitzschiae]MBM2293770.1 hypothetical protein [Pseudosulfitobacter pseudonitzschiae]MBM2298688.1 hypothetical protein [Pseudosulfitobacter pseudonitzschiae]MBM2303602.1 hypothetical protein [Pseudosulfitobacter pseudonitzschiae]MBM2313385.1 hypothetical protein [Pseudosulfitobacter pseudonitzschiae]MBM2318298.1 hypothetical protein [Pseudosulfitobacter pseudonitzschiae]
MTFQKNQQLYTLTGEAFAFDHAIDGTAYVRPMIVVTYQSGYGDEIHEEQVTEAAGHFVAMPSADLFTSPPVGLVDSEIQAKRKELDELSASAAKELKQTKAELSKVQFDLSRSKGELDRWMDQHRPLIDVGKLMDGQTLYPLSVRENPYHKGREIPRIPSMRNAGILTLTSGNFEKGQPWVCKQYASDTYGSSFRFFDTEEERSAVISAEFDAACDHFRAKPDFDTTSYTTGTTLHYGTLQRWVEAHPALSIPDDIEAIKAENDAKKVAERKAKLAAELASIDGGVVE